MIGWLVLALVVVLYASCAFLVGVVVGRRLAEPESCVSCDADGIVERVVGRRP